MRFLKALPSRTDRINWLVLILSLGICLVLAGIIGSLSSQRAADPFIRRSSTFFSDGSGMLAAYLVSVRMLPSAERLQRPYSTLELFRPQDRFSSLILAGPLRHLTPGSADALDRWISQGGQLILACDQEWPIGTGSRSLSELLRDEEHQAGQGTKREEPPPAPGTRQAGSAEQPPPERGYLKRHGIALNRSPASDSTPASDPSAPLELNAWMDPQGLEPLVDFEGRVLAGALRLGEGRLVVIPDRLAFSNQRLRESSNAVWLIQTVAAWRNGRAAFDEYHHGFGVRRSYLSLLASFAATPWGWACLQASLAGLAYLLIYRRRFGQLQEAGPPDRRSPLQMVQARGQLLAAARARPLAIEWMHRSLNLKLSRSLGYPVDLDEQAARSRLSSGTSRSARLAREYLQRYQELRSRPALCDQDLVDLGRSAGRLAGELQAGSGKTS